MISATWEVELPSNVAHKYNIVDSSGNISSELLAGASMFRLSAKLMSILRDILDTVYRSLQSQLPNKPAFRDTELLRQSLELNDRLDEFSALMPERLINFLEAASSVDLGRAWDLSLHEQAIITRSVPPTC
jgi:hypothetical protein